MMLRFYCLFGITLFTFSSAGGNEEIRNAFDEYLEQKSLFFSLPTGGNEVHEAAFIAAREDVYEYGDEAAKFFASELMASPRMGYRVDILDFLSEDGFGKDRILPVVRQLVAEAELDEAYPAVVAVCARYLSKIGSTGDVGLLRRLEQHSNPGVVLAAEVGIKRLRGIIVETPPEERGNIESLRVSADDQPSQGDDLNREDRKLERLPAEETAVISNTEDVPVRETRQWPLIFGAIVVLGILVLYLRVFFRRRAS